MGTVHTLKQYVQRVIENETLVDFTVIYHGSISVITPLSPAASEWLDEHVVTDEVQRWGRNGVVVEHRYVRDILDGMLDAGLRSPNSP